MRGFGFIIEYYFTGEKNIRKNINMWMVAYNGISDF